MALERLPTINGAAFTNRVQFVGDSELGRDERLDRRREIPCAVATDDRNVRPARRQTGADRSPLGSNSACIRCIAQWSEPRHGPAGAGSAPTPTPATWHNLAQV